ncbi:hypothetical protein ACWEOE_09515 [Amycolatopsis sp. NPDC004368]
MAEKDDNTAETSDDLGKPNADEPETGGVTASPSGAGEPVQAEPPRGAPTSGEPAQPEHPQPEPTPPAAPQSEGAQPQSQPEPVRIPPIDYPPAPPVPGCPEQEDGKAPGPVKAAFILTIVASVVLLIGQVVTIVFKHQLVDQAVKATPPGRKLDMAQLESNANLLVWALFVGALCYGVIMVLFAYKAREGTRSARTVVTMLALLGLVFQLGLVRSVFSLVSSLLLVIVVVLLYLPSTRDYFPKVGKQL